MGDFFLFFPFLAFFLGVAIIPQQTAAVSRVLKNLSPSRTVLLTDSGAQDPAPNNHVSLTQRQDWAPVSNRQVGCTTLTLFKVVLTSFCLLVEGVSVSAVCVARGIPGTCPLLRRPG